MAHFPNTASIAIYDLENILNYFSKDEVIERTLSSEEVLFQQGSPTHAIYFVVDGEIRLETYLEDGRRYRVLPRAEWWGSQ